jgi:ribonuclease E
LFLRRLGGCLGRDGTRHQVAEVTSLGLVQMTRKRIGTGLLEAFSETCEACQGRGLILRDVPVEPKKSDDDSRRGGRRGKGRGRGEDNRRENGEPKAPTPKDIAAMAPKKEQAEAAEPSETPETPEPASTEPRAAQPAAEETPAKAARKVKPEQPETEARPEQPEAVQPEQPESAEVSGKPAAAAEEAESTQPPAPPEKPKVVTRTRRRSASRPAGPPAATTTGSDEPTTGDVLAEEPGAKGQVGEIAETGQVEPGTVDSEPGTGASLTAMEHVPIKKKGSRKR